MTDGWQKRDSSNLIVIGDGEGQARKVGGLLASIAPDPRYPDNRRYELVQQDGTSKIVAGTTVVNNQIGIHDIGKFIKLSFEGWGSGGNGKFKNIDVQVFEGAPTDDMKKWPRFAELHGRKASVAAPLDETPTPLGEESDDDSLPF